MIRNQQSGPHFYFKTKHCLCYNFHILLWLILKSNFSSSPVITLVPTFMEKIKHDWPTYCLKYGHILATYSYFSILVFGLLYILMSKKSNIKFQKNIQRALKINLLNYYLPNFFCFQIWIIRRQQATVDRFAWHRRCRKFTPGWSTESHSQQTFPECFLWASKLRFCLFVSKISSCLF